MRITLSITLESALCNTLKIHFAIPSYAWHSISGCLENTCSLCLVVDETAVARSPNLGIKICSFKKLKLFYEG